MPTAKEPVREVPDTRPEDSSCGEIMSEPAFDRMVARGMADVRADRVIENADRIIENDEMKRRIRLGYG
ncbi:MAG: hypothetical protein JW781_05555 [Deltaproteobacteria bacterium]|nr:hypothetical protein [Candidatus Anaeroferrophillacea bacterium]